jgi:hypothetical protein
MNESRCYACKGHLYWRPIYGVVVCWRCHPPGSKRLVADIVWDGEVKWRQPCDEQTETSHTWPKRSRSWKIVTRIAGGQERQEPSGIDRDQEREQGADQRSSMARIIAH